MKKLINRVLGVVVAAALLVGTAMPNVAVMAATGHSHHGTEHGETDLNNSPTIGKYTITLKKPTGVTVETSAAYGAYQIFTGKVPETPKNVGESVYDSVGGGGYQNPGDKNVTLPITDIKWGNAFGDDTKDAPNQWQANVVQFVIALGAASRSATDNATNDYIFHNFDGFESLVTYDGSSYYLASDYVDGSSVNVTGKLDASLNNVKYDKLAVKVAQILEGKKTREWLQAFADILGGYTGALSGTYDDDFLEQFYGGSWQDEDYKISVPTAGYYMIIDQTEIDETNEAYSARMLFVANNITQTLKEDIPKLDKKIEREANKYYDTEVAGVGDVVDFRLTGTLPSNYVNYISGYQYKFVDTLSKGLTLDNVEETDIGGDGLDVEITVKAKGLFKWEDSEWNWESDIELDIPRDYIKPTGSVPNDNHEHIEKYNYTAQKTSVPDTNEDILTVEFPCLREIRIEKDGSYYCLGYNGPDPSNGKFGSSRIYVDYSATVNSNAVVKPKEGSEYNGNMNRATLTYSNNPQSYADTDNTPEQEAIVYTFGLDIVKIDAAEFLKSDGKEDGAGVQLKDAEFVLIRENPTGKYQIADFTEVPAVVDGPFNGAKYFSINEWHELVAITENLQTVIDEFLDEHRDDGIYEVASDEKGAINISGLDAGVKYTMVETKAPGTDGQYEKIDPFEIELVAAKAGDEYNGKLNSATSAQDVGKDKSFSLEKYVDIIDPGKDGTDPQDDNGSAKMLVANFKYVDLPSTGGIGIYPFYIIGGIVVAGSIILFALSRRKKTA